MAATKQKGKWQDFENVKAAIVSLEEKLGHFPTQREIVENGFSGLPAAITREYGTINALAEKLGKTTNQRERGYWKNQENFKNEFNTVVVELGHIPNYTELKELHGPLLRSIERHYDGYNNFLKEQNLEISRKEEFYWADPKNAVAEVRALMQQHNLATLPNANVLEELGATSVTHAINKYYGGFRKFRLLLGEKPPRIEMGQWKDVDYCIEQANEIKKKLNVTTLPSNNVLREKGYQSFLQAIYKYHNGLRKFRELLGEDQLKNADGIWKDEEYTFTELEKFMQQHGYKTIPTYNTFKQQDAGPLLYGIQKFHGGLDACREKLKERERKQSDSLENLLEAYVNGDESIDLEETYGKPADFWSEWNNIEPILKKIIGQYGSLPSGKKLSQEGKSMVAAAIYKYHGGFHKVRKKLELEEIKKPSKYWKQWKNVKKELEQIIQTVGHFPSTSEMGNEGLSTLAMAINNFGGVNKVRKKLGYETIEHKVKEYESWEKIEEIVRPIIEELGSFPSASELRRRGLGQLVTALYDYHGGINVARKKLGYEIKKCEYADEEGLRNGLEKMWRDHPEINNEIPPDNWMRDNELDELGYAIVKYHGGFRVLREKLGKKPLHKYKRGHLETWNNVASELIKLSSEHPELDGELPSLDWMRDNGYLSIGQAIITYHGGFTTVREKLGKEQLRVEDGYWKDFDNVEKILKKVIEENPELNGEFPTVKWLEKNNLSGLYFGINRHHGGIRNVREKMGFTNETKPFGYWKEWKNVESELIPLIEQYGRLPGNWMLNKLGHKSLATAICQYHGGMNLVREKMQEHLDKYATNNNLETFLEDYAGGNDDER
ncbi:MAG: hypothetical protein AABX16_01845 [Nanoarchaeota archaeon]